MSKKKKLKKYVLIFTCIYLFTYLFLSRMSLYLNRQYEDSNFYYILIKEAVLKVMSRYLFFTLFYIMFTIRCIGLITMCFQDHIVRQVCLCGK